MKKFLSLVTAGCMLVSLAVVANANPDSSHTITAAYGTPVIDGQMDDIWNDTEMQVQDSFRSGTETDAKAQIRCMYDDTYFYVLEYVPDNTLWTSDLTLANYQYDTTEVCISMSNTTATSYSLVDDWWIGITPYGVRNTDSKATVLIGSGTDVSDAEYVTVHTSLENDPDNDSADGYWVEWAFNFKAIDPDFVMAEGTTIGMEISVNDNAEYNSRTMCMGWADTTDAASSNPSVFGNVVFGASGTAEEPVTYTYPASGTDGNLITGEIIGNETGWGDNAAAGAAAAFDGNPATFFDPLGVGDGYCGIKAAEAYTLDKVAILSRDSYGDRFLGAMIQGSNDGENWTTLWTSDAAAASTTEYTIVTDFENNTGYSMYRYYNETSHGDVAEVEFYGTIAAAATPAEEETVTVETEAPVTEAAQTFDFGVIAAIAAVVSLAGYSVAKKK